MGTCSEVSGGSEPLKKSLGATKRQPGHKKTLIIFACKAQGNQHEIRIAFFEGDNNIFHVVYRIKQSIVID